MSRISRYAADLGEATYAMMIKPGEEIIASDNQHFRVLAVVRFEEEGRVAVRGAAPGRGAAASA